MKEIFCVRDRKAQIFLPPFFDVNKVQAQRAFERACKDSKSPFNEYPDDYELLHLGQFCENTGRFTQLDFPSVMASPRDFLVPAPMHAADASVPRVAQ